jgi:hypothetical protein
LPDGAGRLPLRPHCNPLCALYYSLGVFLDSLVNSYPLLQKWFQKAITLIHRPMDADVILYPPFSLKAGYTVHRHYARKTVFIQSRTFFICPCRRSNHKFRPPRSRVHARMPLRIAPPP